MSEARRVHTVRLTAPDAGLVRHGARLLEDALQTASLPFPDRRLILVRSLDVGVIAAGGPPAALSRKVEQRLHHLASEAVHADSPAALTAPVVYFRDVLEPYPLLALRLIRDGRIDGWFWRLAVPGWTAPLSRQAGLRRLIAALLEPPRHAAELVFVLQTLLEAGALPAMLEVLRPEDGPVLLRACGWSAVEATEGSPIEQPPASWRRTLIEQAHRWGKDDARTQWLAAVALVASRSARMLRGDLPGQARRLVTDLLALEPSRNAAPTVPQAGSARLDEPPTGTAPLQGVDDAPAPLERLHDAVTLPVGSRVRLAAPERVGEEPLPTPQPRSGLRAGSPDASGLTGPSACATARTPGTHHPAIVQEHPTAGPTQPSNLSNDLTRNTTTGEPAPTSGAGLLFTVAILERLGLVKALEQNPTWIEFDFPQRLFQHLADGVGLADDDAIRRALPGVVSAMNPPLRAGRRLTRRPATLPPFDQSGRHRPLLRGARPPGRDGLLELLERWRRAVTDWCRRYVGIGLRALVLRPGKVSWTRTHIDVSLPSSQVELRIRRAGLDLDPGWVPWLGRVVTFHYEYGVHDVR